MLGLCSSLLALLVISNRSAYLFVTLFVSVTLSTRLIGLSLAASKSACHFLRRFRFEHRNP